MDFEIEIDDDEVLTMTIDELPKKKLRIQVESLTVRGKLPDRQSRPSTVGECWPIVEGVAPPEPETGPGTEPPWLRHDIEAVVLAHMRDFPQDQTSLNAAAWLETADFRANRYALMFKAIRGLMLKRTKVTPTSISEEARSIDPSLSLAAWYADAVGGENDDVTAEQCLSWMLARRILAEK